MVKDLTVVVDNLSAEYKKTLQQFKEQQERYDACIAKMTRDKRAMIALHDENLRKIEKNARLITIVQQFIEQVAYRVN